MISLRRTTTLTFALLLVGSSAYAQSASAALNKLIVGSPGSDAILSQSQTQSLIEFIGTNINTFPTASGSAALVDVPIGTSGDEHPLAQSFGTMLLDRWATSGGSISASIYTDARRWRYLDGIHLASGGLQVRLPGGVGSSSSIDLRSETVGIQSQFGIMKSLDLGINVPFERVCVRGTREELNGGYANLVSADGCSQGLGDVSLRVKYIGLMRQTWGAAVGADLYLPTGNRDALLGRGSSQGRLFGTVAKQLAAVQLSGEIAAVVGGHGTQFSSATVFGTQLLRITSVEPSNELQGGVSVDFVPPQYQRVTVFAESMTRIISNLASYETFGGADNQSIESHPVVSDTQEVIAAGAKLLLGSRWIAGVAATFVPTHIGLTPALGVLAQIERNFRKEK